VSGNTRKENKAKIKFYLLHVKHQKQITCQVIREKKIKPKLNFTYCM